MIRPMAHKGFRYPYFSEESAWLPTWLPPQGFLSGEQSFSTDPFNDTASQAYEDSDMNVDVRQVDEVKHPCDSDRRETFPLFLSSVSYTTRESGQASQEGLLLKLSPSSVEMPKSSLNEGDISLSESSSEKGEMAEVKLSAETKETRQAQLQNTLLDERHISARSVGEDLASCEVMANVSTYSQCTPCTELYVPQSFNQNENLYYQNSIYPVNEPLDSNNTNLAQPHSFPLQTMNETGKKLNEPKEKLCTAWRRRRKLEDAVIFSKQEAVDIDIAVGLVVAAAEALTISNVIGNEMGYSQVLEAALKVKEARRSCGRDYFLDTVGASMVGEESSLAAQDDEKMVEAFAEASASTFPTTNSYFSVKCLDKEKHVKLNNYSNDLNSFATSEEGVRAYPSINSHGTCHLVADRQRLSTHTVEVGSVSNNPLLGMEASKHGGEFGIVKDDGASTWRNGQVCSGDAEKDIFVGLICNETVLDSRIGSPKFDAGSSMDISMAEMKGKPSIQMKQLQCLHLKSDNPLKDKVMHTVQDSNEEALIEVAINDVNIHATSSEKEGIREYEKGQDICEGEGLHSLDPSNAITGIKDIVTNDVLHFNREEDPHQEQNETAKEQNGTANIGKDDLVQTHKAQMSMLTYTNSHEQFRSRWFGGWTGSEVKAAKQGLVKECLQMSFAKPPMGPSDIKNDTYDAATTNAVGTSVNQKFSHVVTAKNKSKLSHKHFIQNISHAIHKKFKARRTVLTNRLQWNNSHTVQSVLGVNKSNDYVLTKNGRYSNRSKTIFQGIKFLLAGFSKNENRVFSLLIRRHGGVVLSKHFDKYQGIANEKEDIPFFFSKASIVVAPYQMNTTKLMYGCAVKCLLLHPKWIIDSISGRHCLPYDKYMWNPRSVYITRQLTEKLPIKTSITKLFSRMRFMVYGKPTFCLRLSTLIKYSGGKVFKNFNPLIHLFESMPGSTSAIIVQDGSMVPRHLRQCAMEYRISVMSEEWIIGCLILERILPYST